MIFLAFALLKGGVLKCVSILAASICYSRGNEGVCEGCESKKTKLQGVRVRAHARKPIYRDINDYIFHYSHAQDRRLGSKVLYLTDQSWRSSRNMVY